MSGLKKLLCTAALAAAAIAVPVSAAAPITVRLATQAPVNSTWHKALLDMGAQWDAKTSSRVKVTVYAGGMQGDEPSTVRMMRPGVDQLQASLLKIDLKQTLTGMIVPSVVAIAGAIVLLSCVPILLASVALLLVETLEWSYAQAFFCSLGFGLLIGGLACLAGAWFVRRSLEKLERSKSEFVHNVTWIKQVLKRLGSSPQSAARWNGG